MIKIKEKIKLVEVCKEDGKLIFSVSRDVENYYELYAFMILNLELMKKDLIKEFKREELNEDDLI